MDIWCEKLPKYSNGEYNLQLARDQDSEPRRSSKLAVFKDEVSMRLLVLVLFLLLSLVAFATSLLANQAKAIACKVGAEIKGRWNQEDNSWVSNSSESTSLSRIHS